MTTLLDSASCPNCGSEMNRRAETRERVIGGVNVIWRRRVCKTCRHQWKTGELPLALVEEICEGSE